MQGLSRDAIRGKIYSCIPKNEDKKPVDYLNIHLGRFRSGETQNLEIADFPLLSEYGQFFQPNNQVLLYSQPGAGKTIFSSRMADKWILDTGIKVKRLLLESSLSFHMLRSLSQLSGRTDLLKPRFHFRKPNRISIYC